jgi:hypothetical protein
MTMHSQHNAGAFLDRAGDIGQLMSKARELLELRRAVVRLLPDGLSRSCTVANARQGKVVIYANSSVAAAKLKLVLPALRNQLLEAGQHVTALTVEVQPPARQHSTVEKPQLTKGAAESLSRAADALPDSDLKKILRELASRAV